MTLCTEKLVEYGFLELGLDHVLIAVAKDNFKSRRIPEKRLEGFKMLEWVKDTQMLYEKEVEMVTYIKSVENPKYSHKDLPLSGIYGGEKQQRPDNNRWITVSTFMIKYKIILYRINVIIILHSVYF